MIQKKWEVNQNCTESNFFFRPKHRYLLSAICNISGASPTLLDCFSQTSVKLNEPADGDSTAFDRVRPFRSRIKQTLNYCEFLFRPD